MGSLIEINYSLKVSKDRGFPKELLFDNHNKNPESSKKFLGQILTFWNFDERFYARDPTRVWLVEEMKD